ncbi:hypothetical protein [Variovorax rhizosphaerae]|uniref:DUF4189 domain-containing protein n=1 Tax=Variovorax rhizosphaerae TaxID=1836200 RepID=A0ABU8WXI6_9BURK
MIMREHRPRQWWPLIVIWPFVYSNVPAVAGHQPGPLVPVGFVLAPAEPQEEVQRKNVKPRGSHAERSTKERVTDESPPAGETTRTRLKERERTGSPGKAASTSASDRRSAEKRDHAASATGALAAPLAYLSVFTADNTFAVRSGNSVSNAESRAKEACEARKCNKRWTIANDKKICLAVASYVTRSNGTEWNNYFRGLAETVIDDATKEALSQCNAFRLEMSTKFKTNNSPVLSQCWPLWAGCNDKEIQ